jgi:hypothetical protein
MLNKIMTNNNLEVNNATITLYSEALSCIANGDAETFDYYLGQGYDKETLIELLEWHHDTTY